MCGLEEVDRKGGKGEESMGEGKAREGVGEREG